MNQLASPIDNRATPREKGGLAIKLAFQRGGFEGEGRFYGCSFGRGRYDLKGSIQGEKFFTRPHQAHAMFALGSHSGSVISNSQIDSASACFQFYSCILGVTVLDNVSERLLRHAK